MKKYAYIFLLFILNHTLGFTQGCGALIKPLSIRERANEASHIIEGKVIASKGYWDINKHDIYTVHTVNTYKGFKGKSNTTFKIVTKGGQVDNHFQLTTSAASLQPGTEGTFFIKKFKGQIAISASLYQLVGAVQGVVKYNRHTGKASDVFTKYASKENDLYTQIQQVTGNNVEVVSGLSLESNLTSVSASNPIVYSFSPLTTTAGTQTVLTITGNNFGSDTGTVSFANANDGGATMVDAADSEILSWSNTLIEVEIPYEAGTGTIEIGHSDGSTHETTVPLTITYSHNNLNNSGTILGLALQDIDGNGGYTFSYHNDFNSSSAKTYFEEAFGLWNCESNINFSFGNTTATDESISDGINIVRFDNGNELSSGVLGSVTTRFTTFCGTTSRVLVDEIDITWNDDTNWYYGSGSPSASQYDFKTVALHELGHAHQLGHVIDADLVMHYSLGAGDERYYLHENDIEGAVYTMGIYTQSIGCGNTAMTEKLNCCDPIVINADPQDTEVGVNGTTTFSITATDYESISWFRSTDGNSWTALSNDSVYSGTASTTLTLTNVPASYDGYLYRAYFENICGDLLNSDHATLTVYGYTTIPDTNFEAALEALGHDDISDDGQIPENIASTITSLDVSSQSISDLTGIEDFTGLITLKVQDNNLTSIDVSNNTMLQTLNVSTNNLTAIDVSKLSDLKNLFANYNELADIDVSSNADLTELNVIDNLLTTLDVTKNTQLRSLQFHFNSLTQIDLSNNAALDFLSGRDNNLTALDVSNNLLLESIWCGSNVITSLDISNNPLVRIIQMGSNELTDVNLKNGNNTNVTSFNISNNDNLLCILVDDADYSTTNWTSVDAQVTFNDVHCDYTVIPDTNFEAALEALGYDDISNDGKVPTGSIDAITSLDVSSQSISDITGIEDFVALTTLKVHDNNLSSIDISNNTALQTLNVSTNNLTSIDVSNLWSLKNFSASYNSLTAIDVSNNAALIELNVIDNLLTALDVTKNTQLESLQFHFNSLTEIDLSNNSMLDFLSGRDNNLVSLDVSNNPLLEKIWCGSNVITSIDITNNPQVTIIQLGDNNLTYANLKNGNNTSVTSFNMNNNENLTCILVDDADYSTTNWTAIDDHTGFSSTAYCRYTMIPNANFEIALDALGYDDISGDGQVPTALIENVTSLQIGENSIDDVTGLEDFAALTELEFYQIGLSSIDLSKNTLLEKVSLDNNPLTSLDLTGLTYLTDVNVSGTDITSIDVSSNTSLSVLDVSGNDYLSVLDVRNANNTNFTSFNAINNPSLYCIQVDDMDYSTTNWSVNVDDQVRFIETDYCTYTAIPDANFEAALEALGYDDISSDGQVPTDLIKSITSLTVSSKNIADLTGIQDFVSLQVLYCENNSLSTLEVNTLSNLVYLSFSGNSVSSLDVSALSKLQILECEYNNITILDVSSNTNLDTIDIRHNDLISLNVRNGNNTRMGLEEFQAQDNENLTCILVDDVSYSNSVWRDIDDHMFFSDTYCDYTAIPDENFESLLEDLGYDDVSGDGQVPTINIETITSLEIGAKSISNVSGIEDFIDLEIFRAPDNNLSTIDLSNNEKLQIIDLRNNSLSTIDLSSNTEIYDLDLGNNNLTTLETSGLTNLETINVEGNSLDSLDISDNSASLTQLILSDNSQLTAIDLSNMEVLQEVSCDNCTALLSITLESNTDLENLYLNNTPLTSVDANEAPSLKALSIDETSIAQLDVSNNTLLEELFANDGALTALNLKNGNNTNISSLEITGNPDLYCVQVDDVDYATTNLTNKDPQTSFSENCVNEIFVSLKVILEGAFDLGDDGILMQDDLRDNGVLPNTSPYEDGISCDTLVLNTHGATAVVDWVEVQLRNETDITEVLARTSALLLRDGTIVSVDGSSAVAFSEAAGDYHIAIAHRNHLTIASSSTQLVTDTALSLDFRQTANVLNAANALSDMGDGYYAMPAGDVDGNGQVQNADIDSANEGVGSSGYSNADVDMNAQVQNSDIQSIILQNSGKGEQLFVNE